MDNIKPDPKTDGRQAFMFNIFERRPDKEELIDIVVDPPNRNVYCGIWYSGDKSRMLKVQYSSDGNVQIYIGKWSNKYNDYLIPMNSIFYKFDPVILVKCWEYMDKDIPIVFK